MTNEEELEILSTRYIAPRVVRLSSGNIAIIPMMGRSAPTIVPAHDFIAIIRAIPSIDDLETQSRAIAEAHRTRPAAAPKPFQPTLDDLA